MTFLVNLYVIDMTILKSWYSGNIEIKSSIIV